MMRKALGILIQLKVKAMMQKKNLRYQTAHSSRHSRIASCHSIKTANVTDRKGALETYLLNKSVLSEVKNVLANRGYSGEPFSNSIQEILGCEVEITKRNELHAFKLIAKRWVAERSFSWLEKCRR
ncbi:hypothetical protein PRO82_000935 [Candidatus Protochlamydia amoebophila]|nr:hypothetical protein [Candidatus Protochlamydia amoebophila]